MLDAKKHSGWSVSAYPILLLLRILLFVPSRVVGQTRAIPVGAITQTGEAGATIGVTEWLELVV